MLVPDCLTYACRADRHSCATLFQLQQTSYHAQLPCRNGRHWTPNGAEHDPAQVPVQARVADVSRRGRAAGGGIVDRLPVRGAFIESQLHVRRRLVLCRWKHEPQRHRLRRRVLLRWGQLPTTPFAILRLGMAARQARAVLIVSSAAWGTTDHIDCIGGAVPPTACRAGRYGAHAGLSSAACDGLW